MARRLAWLCASTIVLVVAWTALPSFLVVADSLPARADAIYVFPGELPERVRCAAELYRRGIAPLVVFSGGSIRPELEVIGAPLTDAAVGALLAARSGVPASAEVVLPQGTSTWEDAGILRHWAEAAGSRQVVAVTSPLHSRRARHTLRLTLEPIGTRVFVVPCGPRLPTTGAWWLEERPLLSAVSEMLKLALYWVRYFAPTALGLTPPPGATPRDSPRR